jgi:hypothetical protein
MIETTATLIMIVSEGVRIPREVHTLLTRNGYPVVEAMWRGCSPETQRGAPESNSSRSRYGGRKMA